MCNTVTINSLNIPETFTLENQGMCQWAVYNIGSLSYDVYQYNGDPDNPDCCVGPPTHYNTTLDAILTIGSFSIFTIQAHNDFTIQVWNSYDIEEYCPNGVYNLSNENSPCGYNGEEALGGSATLTVCPSAYTQ